MIEQSIKEIFTLLLWDASEGTSLPTTARQIITAHGAMESGWGASQAFKLGNNPFNVTRPHDSSARIITGNDVEFDKGEMKRIIQRFAAYESLNAACSEYVKFIQHPRYEGALELLNAGDAAAYFTYLGKCGFYTLPVKTYLSAVLSCLNVVQTLTNTMECKS